MALAALLPFLLLAAWARLAPVAAWEIHVSVGLALGDDGYAATVRAINTAGDLVPWSLMVTAVALGAMLLRRAWAGLLVALTLLADLAGFVVKLAVERIRPETALGEHLGDVDSFAFPSGHVVRATALVAVLVWLLAPSRLRLPLAVLAGVLAGALMGYARVALGVHWPTDAAGGMLLGIGWFAATAWAVAQRAR